MMTKKTIILISIMTIFFTVATIAATSAAISIGLTISEVGEYSGEDDDDKITEENKTDEDGVAFSFTPTGTGEIEEKEYRMRIITNTEFELEYFWENYENIDPRISAFLNLKQEDYTYKFISSDEFKTFINDALLVGKNPVERSSVKLQSSELNFKPDKELKFKVVYDPSVIEGSFKGTNTENILRVIVTFIPPSDL